VPLVYEVEAAILLVVGLALLAVKIFALATSLMFSTEHYRAADKLSKPAWVAILALGVVANLLLDVSPVNVLNLAFTIAALVFLTDVRPALSSLHQR